MRNSNKKEHIYVGVALVLTGVCLLLIMAGVFGRSGTVVATFLRGILGYAIIAYAIIMTIIGIARIFNFKTTVTPIKLSGLILMVVSLIMLAQVFTTVNYVLSYGEYLTFCYKNANSIGGALFGILTYPIMKINYYFAIVLTSLLFIGSTIMAFFVEITSKVTYRNVVKKRGDINNITSLDSGADNRLYTELYDEHSDDISIPQLDNYIPLSQIDNYETQHKAQTLSAENKFVAPKCDLRQDDVTVNIVTDREKAINALYPERSVIDGEPISSYMDDIAERKMKKENSEGSRNENECSNEELSQKQAYDTLYQKENEIKKRNSIKLEGDYSNYTNDTRKRIIEENISKARNMNANTNPIMVNGNSNDNNETDNKIADTNYPYESNGQNSSYNGQKSGGIDTRDNGNIDTQNINGYKNINNGNNSPVNNGNISQHSDGNNNANNRPIYDNTKPPITDKDAYREYLLNKRKERSDKGGMHNTYPGTGDNSANSNFGNEPAKNDAFNNDGSVKKSNTQNPFIKTPQNTANNNDGLMNKKNNSFDTSSASNRTNSYGSNASAELSAMQNGGYVYKEEPVENLIKPKLRPYKSPPISLLRDYVSTPPDNEDFAEKIELLENKLATFNIKAKVVNVVTGPTFSRLELAMPVGISVNRINTYANDIAMCLKARSVRCEIPIPGKDLFGVEIPNKSRGTVGLKSLLNSPQFNNNKHLLSVALGQDCDGVNYVVDLVKLVHLLVAGATGAGKSVCINAILCSLLYKYSPDDLKIALVDPKQVELSMYNGLPHMLVRETICDNNKVISLLDWVIEEMERRYSAMSERKAKDLQDYNENIDPSVEKKWPYIVVIIDEVADIVVSMRREFDSRIMRLSQKSRSAGIILVLATQRPSVDVITGTIKNNLPSRIAFAVTQYEDSRTIIGQGGAEKLLRNGDMLLSESTSPDLIRIQGVFISGREVDAVCEYIKQNNDVWFDPAIERAILKEKPSGGDMGSLGNGSANGAEVDTLFIKAVWNVVESGQASSTRLQRVLGMGFPKAAKFIDKMAELGYISQPNTTNKTRTVILTMDEFVELYGHIDISR